MDEKVYTPAVIADSPFPDSEPIDINVTQEGSGDNYSAEKINNTPLPLKRIAQETIGQALNTKSRKILAEFEFELHGAIQIGKYEDGVSGDVKISPNGIVARDSAGLTTFALDGTTGSAVFKGSVQAGSIITGLVQLGDGYLVLDGYGRRIVLYDEDGVTPRIVIGVI